MGRQRPVSVRLSPLDPEAVSLSSCFLLAVAAAPPGTVPAFLAGRGSWDKG